MDVQACVTENIAMSAMRSSIQERDAFSTRHVDRNRIGLHRKLLLECDAHVIQHAALPLLPPPDMLGLPRIPKMCRNGTS